MPVNERACETVQGLVPTPAPHWCFCPSQAPRSASLPGDETRLPLGFVGVMGWYGWEAGDSPETGQGTPTLSPGVQTEDLCELESCCDSRELSPGSRPGFNGGAENSNIRWKNPPFSLPPHSQILEIGSQLQCLVTSSSFHGNCCSPTLSTPLPHPLGQRLPSPPPSPPLCFPLPTAAAERSQVWQVLGRKMQQGRQRGWPTTAGEAGGHGSGGEGARPKAPGKERHGEQGMS